MYAVGLVGLLTFTPTYFPLYDPGFPGWYDGSHNVPGGVTGFISAICYEGEPVGLADIARTAVPTAWADGHGNWIVAGIPNGLYSLHILDALGRVIIERKIKVTNGSGYVEAAALAHGMYTITIPEVATIKFIHQP